MMSKNLINGSWYRLLLLHNTRRFSETSPKWYPSASDTNNPEAVTTDVLDQENEENNLYESKQNKSGLRPYHYNIAHKKIPFFTEDELEVMELWKYRKLFGRYGSAANIDMKALWPSVIELEYMKEREKLEYPHTVHEMIDMAKTARLEEEGNIMERQEKLKANLKKLEKWKKDMATRIEKHEREAKITLEMKQKQIEEVREILGYRISPHDPQFQEILEKKMEEDKKKAKKEKKLLRQQQMLEKLTETAKRDSIAPESKEGEQPDSLYGKKIE